MTALAITPLGSARANATTIQVEGGEFYFKLSTKTIAKPATVTFIKNVGVKRRVDPTRHNSKVRATAGETVS